MEVNDTFVYDSREEARAAAIAKGFDLDDVAVTTAKGKWGWFTMDELDGGSSNEPVSDDDDDAPMMGGSEAESQVETETSEPAAVETASPDPTPVAANDEITADQPEREAEPGDMILQANGPMLPMAARLMAEKIASRFGLKVTLRDSMSMDVVGVVLPRAGGKKGAKSPTEKAVIAPNSDQEIIIRLCSRPEGATSEQLREAGCHSFSKKNTIPWKQFVMACATKFGFEFRLGSVVENNRAIAVYHLDASTEAANDATHSSLAIGAD